MKLRLWTHAGLVGAVLLSEERAAFVVRGRMPIGSRRRAWVAAWVVVMAAYVAPLTRARAESAAEIPSAERGREALLGRCFSDAFVSRAGYDTLWKQWGLKSRPEDFDTKVRTRYGLHQAPYPNDGL